MKTIVFIGVQKSGSSREAIRAAEELGYYTVLLTNRKTFLEKRDEFPDVHLMQFCDLDNTEEIRRIIQRLLLKALNICAVVSFTDPYCHTACLLGDELGVNRFSTEAIGRMQDKLLSRQALSQTHFSPKFASLSKNDLLSQEKIAKLLPLVVKSPNSTGSKDVYKVSSFSEFKHYFDKLSEKYPDSPVLVEEFLDGPQYLVEAMVYNKEINIIAVIKQEITYYNKHFIVTGYNLLHDMQESFNKSIIEAVSSIIERHGMETGACHLEMRYVKGMWKLIEINPRISGGGMNKLIEIGRGINLVRETLKMALGNKPDLKPCLKEYVFAQYVITTKSGILDRVAGKSMAWKSPGARMVYVKPRKGSTLIPPASMGNRYAYVIATGKNEESAIKNAKNAASQIRFILLPLEEEHREEIELREDYEEKAGISLNISEFEDYLMASERSKRTAHNYFLELKRYCKWYEESFKRECSSLERDAILKYKNYLLNIRHNCSKTVNTKLGFLKKFNEFLIEREIQSDMVVNKTDMIKITKH